MQILNSIRERFAGRRLDAETKYAGFVSDSAAGRDSDPATLTSVLNLTGRSARQFVADVERIERRRNAHQQLDEAAKLQPSGEVASKAAADASLAVDVARVKAASAVSDAIRLADEKADLASEIGRKIDLLTRQTTTTLMSTADPSLQAEIDQFTVKLRDLRIETSTLNVRCDPTEAASRRMALDAEEARLQARLDELRQQQLA